MKTRLQFLDEMAPSLPTWLSGPLWALALIGCVVVNPAYQPPGDADVDEADGAPDSDRADAEASADGDGVHDGDSDNDVDEPEACPGPDGDGDGVADSCDPCPSDGPTAPPIALPVSSPEITVTAVSLNGGGNVARVAAFDRVELSLCFEIADCEHPSARDQIEVGLVPGQSHSFCVYDDKPGCHGDSGEDGGFLVAPAEPGVYELRFGFRRDSGCFASSLTWWQGVPPAEQTIGVLCVE